MRVWIGMIAIAAWMPQAGGQATPPAVPAHTPVEIELQESLSSETLHAGQEIAFKVVSPVMVDGETVLAAGMPVGGEVRAAQKAGAFRKAGMLQLALKPIRLESGSEVRLDFPRPRVQSASKEKTGTGIAAVPILLYYFPLIPFAVAENAKKGAAFTIRAAERYRVYVVEPEAAPAEPPDATAPGSSQP